MQQKGAREKRREFRELFQHKSIAALLKQCALAADAVMHKKFMQLFAKEKENEKAFKKSYIEGGGDPIVEDALEAGSP